MRHLPLLLFLTFTCCNPEATARTAAQGQVPGGFLLPPYAEVPAPVADPMVVRTGELAYRVDEVERARSRLLQQVATYGGQVAGDTREQVVGGIEATLLLRIPAPRFDAFVLAIGDLGELQHRRIDAADVTAQAADLDARLTAKREMEQRYLQLFERAASISQVLEVEHQLGIVRGDIEAMEAQRRVLAHQVAMSTLTVTCREPSTAGIAALGFGDALRGGWNGLLRVLVGATYAWPLLLLAVLATTRRLFRRSRLPALPAGS